MEENGDAEEREKPQKKRAQKSPAEPKEKVASKKRAAKKPKVCLFFPRDMGNPCDLMGSPMIFRMMRTMSPLKTSQMKWLLSQPKKTMSKKRK